MADIDRPPTGPKEETSCLEKAVLETAAGMHRTGIMDNDAHAKITLRHLDKPIGAAGRIDGVK